ncbi:hypothetical protein [Indioceanicola profundi]|uniref:hypothetical protein n=1 Tax=Indioceanicola profundi TaxID=2220096 RepID=UPI000E6ABC71|nr:hypothetical protein [Indioceanicola profundi]
MPQTPPALLRNPARPRPAGLAGLAPWAAAITFSLAALLAPALWNGWALVFFDTGGYVRRVLEMGLEPGRSLFYGLFLWAASLGWWSFWGPVLAQAALTLWCIRLMLRTHDLPSGPAATAGVTVALALLTSLPWFAAQLMPDVLVPLLVLALWLLGFRWERLTGAERAGLILLSLLALLSHMSSMALGIGLVLVTAAAWALARWRGWRLHIRILPPAAVVAGSLILMPLLHLALVGQAVYTPGGPVFVFGRLVQDGIAQRWLDANCPRPDVQLCQYRDRMPATANDFIWHEDSPFRQIGWWGGADRELSLIVRESIRSYPGDFLLTGLASTAEQIGKVATGDGLDEWQEVTRWVFRDLLPVSGFEDARQQREEITQGLFDAWSTLHIPVAYLSLLGLAVIAAWAFRCGRHDLAALGLFLLLALLGNAFISGALSNPHDRYQSRLAWIATLAVGMAPMARFRRSDQA